MVIRGSVDAVLLLGDLRKIIGMPKASFYILNKTGTDARLQLVCSLISKAYTKQLKVYVYSEDRVLLDTLDELLWTFEEHNFLPHDVCTDHEDIDELAPVRLSTLAPPANWHDVLIQLSTHMPHFATQFNRIIEVLDQQTDTLTAGRARFAQYRTQLFEMETHTID